MQQFNQWSDSNHVKNQSIPPPKDHVSGRLLLLSESLVHNRKTFLMFYSKERTMAKNKGRGHRFTRNLSPDQGKASLTGISMSASIILGIRAWRSSFSFGQLLFLLLPKYVVIVLFVFLSCTPSRLGRLECNTVNVSVVSKSIRGVNLSSLNACHNLLFGMETTAILGEASNRYTPSVGCILEK